MNLAPTLHQLIIRMLIGVPATVALLAALVGIGCILRSRRMS